MSSPRNPLPQLIPQRVARTKASVDGLLWERVVPLSVEGGAVHREPVGVEQAAKQALRTVVPGEYFGPAGGGWQQRWFRVRLPSAAAGERGRRFLHWRCQGETTAYHAGQPWAGLDLAHPSCPLPDSAAALWLDCSTWQTGIWIGRPDREQIGPYGLRFDGCTLRVRDPLAWDVSCDLDVLQRLLHVLLKQEGITLPAGFGHLPALDACSPLLRHLLRALDDAADTYVAGGLRALRDALRECKSNLPAESWQPAAALCGHAHLDLVWLWPEMATERKGVHTFATQLRLMERYPEVTFVQSQPALYRAIERQAPALVTQLRKRVREGRWEVMGGFEVEPDTNIPSGEALARSLVYGQRKIAALRGAPSPVCWIPDVFGYAACLPQILALGGVRFFYTTKMTWSAITRFPYNSFVWRGSDGTEVLAHLCSTGYNGTVDLENITTALRGHRQADVHPEMLLPTGWGDGGGGMTEAMCERARRIADLAGTPRAAWTTAEAFFTRLEARRARLPVYQGELYLEYHRGTLTTQSEFKRLYRAAESALQAHEAVRVAVGSGGLDERDWLRVAFCQFHDALPGSAIGLVYEQLTAELAGIVTRNLQAAADGLAHGAGARQLVAFNPLPIARTVVVDLPGRAAQRNKRSATDLSMQRVGAGRNARWLTAVSLPPLSSRRVVRAAAGGTTGRRHAVSHAMEVAATRLDNGVVRADFDRAGLLSALGVDGAALEIAAPAGLRLYHDDPANFDAWDIDHYSVRTARQVAAPLELQVIERGPVRAVLRGRAAISDRSRVTVDYILEAGSRYLRIDLTIDWHESHRLLKYHVPTTYRGRWARFGCPFGSILRPQLPGVSADEAMWEVAASRWAAVTHEDGTGLALCTEAKYGFSCRDGDLGLSLLRSPKEPDPTADMGTHLVRFAIGMHTAQTTATHLSTAAAADALFAAVIMARAATERPAPFDWEDLGTLVPSWVLPADTRPGFIVRLHETHGSAGCAILRLHHTARSVQLVDFLERPIGRAARVDRHRYALAYRPYQVLSVHVHT